MSYCINVTAFFGYSELWTSADGSVAMIKGYMTEERYIQFKKEEIEPMPRVYRSIPRGSQVIDPSTSIAAAMNMDVANGKFYEVVVRFDLDNDDCRLRWARGIRTFKQGGIDYDPGLILICEQTRKS